MRHPLASVEDVGTAVRALRKHGGVRIDDFALTAKVSKQFMTDLENGKPTIQMGRVLGLLQQLGVKLVLELPDAVAPTLSAEQARRQRRKAASQPATSSDA